MSPAFDVFEYASYVLSRWRFLAASVLVAVGLAGDRQHGSSEAIYGDGQHSH